MRETSFEAEARYLAVGYGARVALDTRAAWRAWSSYRGAAPATRAFLAARLAVAPLGAMEAELRSLRGRVLSLGSGHGLLDRYLAELNPHVTVEGIELDVERVGLAQATRERSLRTSARVADVRALEEVSAYDAVIAIDVLHHVPLADQEGVVAALHRSLRPGASCLVKDIATTPRWRYEWNRLHDRIVTGSEPVHCRSPQSMAELLAGVGLQVQDTRRVGGGGPYPHYLVVARRAPSP